MGGRRSTVQLAMCHTKTRFVVCGNLLFASRAFALPVDEAERVQRTNGTMAAVDPVIAVLTQTQQDEDANTGDSNELEVGGRGTCKKWCKFENHCKWNACTGCTLCRTPAPTPKTLSFGEAKPMNTKLFGIGDDWTKLKGGGRHPSAWSSRRRYRRAWCSSAWPRQTKVFSGSELECDRVCNQCRHSTYSDFRTYTIFCTSPYLPLRARCCHRYWRLHPVGFG